VQHDALALVEPDLQAPAEPGDHTVVVDREARPLGLRDLDRADAFAIRPAPRREVVVAVFRGNGQVDVIDDVEHVAGDDVDDRDDAVDRVRPAEILRGALHEGEAALDAAAGLGVGQHAGRERVHAQRAQVGEAAAGHRGDPPLVAMHDLFDVRELAHDDRHGAFGQHVDLVAAHHAGFGRAGHHVVRHTGDHVDEETAHLSSPGLAGEQLALVGLLESHVRVVGLVGGDARGSQNVAVRGDLVGGEGGERRVGAGREAREGHDVLSIIGRTRSRARRCTGARRR
jgi:hypothetical protein